MLQPLQKALFYTAFLIAAALVPMTAGAECVSQMEDKYKPSALKCAGKWPCEVKDQYGNFTYQTDVETVGGDFTMNNMICNRDADDLTVNWEKAGLTTSPLNGLTSGCCLTNPHPIPGYDGIDYDAPILYTQSGRTRDASVYKEDHPKADEVQTMESILRTAYRLKDSVKEVVIRVITKLFPQDKWMTVTIERSSSDLSFALGSLWRVTSEKSLLAASAKMTSVLKKEGAEVRLQPVTQALGQRDLKWLPKRMTDDTLLMFRMGKSPRRTIKISFPANKGSIRDYGIKTGVLMVFDNKGALISTGRYSFFGPK